LHVSGKPQLLNGPHSWAQITAFLRNALISVEEEFQLTLKRNQTTITHDTALGDATEEAWINLLKEYLPARYCVNKAFAIDHLGNTTEQLDCLIYDSYFTPKLFGKDKHLYVPAEAVYATFEVKQVVSAQHLKQAAEKAASLRALVRTSASLPWLGGTNPPKPLFPIMAGLLALETDWVDGLGSTFLSNFNQWTGEQELDLVLTASSGFCDRFNLNSSLEIARGKGSLIRGLFRLLNALRAKASVAAIDWEAFEKIFVDY
jgi:hypothetical protein